MRKRMTNRRGGSSIMAVFFVTLFSVLALSFTSMSTVNISMARNHRDVMSAQAAAESGLAFAKYLIGQCAPLISTAQNTVTETEATNVFVAFKDNVNTEIGASPILGGAGIHYNSTTQTVQVPSMGYVLMSSAGTSAVFKLTFQFAAQDDPLPHRIIVTSTGVMGQSERTVQMTFSIAKDKRVLEYACASRGRMWLTGDTTVHGDIFSAWSRTDISPFNVTNDVTIEGTINTVLSQTQIENAPYQFESFDADGNPIYNSSDEINGQHEGIGYATPFDDMPGMDIGDYNTTSYMTGLTNIPTASSTVTEYFPHATGNYSSPKDSGSLRVTRSKYENQTYNNVKLPSNRNALFKNCTFNGILYVDCGTATTSTNYNNVRFENCTFNGVTVTNAPLSFKWQRNCLYYTGSATFNNQSTVQEATILAPHFNVNLGNTNPVSGDANVLTGAIIGGIVDVRGNAEVYGTILSMCDTSAWSSGYVSNIGATTADGGSETTEAGDIGTINITPDASKMLPSGITTPIVINCMPETYSDL